MNKLFIIFLLIALSGCAIVPPKIEVRIPGETDDTHESAIERQAARVRGNIDVTVVHDKMPPELELSDDGQLLTVKPEVSQKFSVLGAVEADFAEGSNAFRTYFWTYNYQSDWRQDYCLFQAPLKLLTIGLWNVVPFAWPCIAKIPSTPESRRKHLIGELRRATYVLGGNLLVITGRSDMEVSSFARSDPNAAPEIVADIGLRGFAIHEQR